MQEYGGRIRPGDLFITNDPYDGSTHLPDIVLVKPIFIEAALIGFSVALAHMTDIGGPHAGRQRERLDRDLPGGTAHSAVAVVARRRARRVHVPPHRAQRARAGQGAGRHPLADRRLRGRRARARSARAALWRGPVRAVLPRPARLHRALHPRARSPSCRRVRGASSTISTATASIRIRSGSRPRSRSRPTT